MFFEKLYVLSSRAKRGICSLPASERDGYRRAVTIQLPLSREMKRFCPLVARSSQPSVVNPPGQLS